MDSSSVGAGFMAVFAVSGSVVLLAHQVHKRLLSNFMKKIEFELVGSHKDHAAKKKVRFAADVVEPSSDNKGYRKKHFPAAENVLDTMPLNRQVLYKGIIEYRVLKGLNISN
ncbi:uncharacterized protein LOC130782918 [Actinidia eriantha]|uniref:uncharacterized protein LOC130782918 n=1 Tax=Actinidia eriantha TaxID=165200 RepID=UPI00258C82B1|nr:uncharacterized protein LOC130782918 [Actinidia eriantha]